MFLGSEYGCKDDGYCYAYSSNVRLLLMQLLRSLLAYTMWPPLHTWKLLEVGRIFTFPVNPDRRPSRCRSVVLCVVIVISNLQYCLLMIRSICSIALIPRGSSPGLHFT